jgi:23S rRNA (guanosine2251-2'-O)-methyltransferase
VTAVIVYGLHAVRALLLREPGRVRQLWLQQGRDDPRSAELRQLALAAGVKCSARPPQELDRLTEAAVHQGAVAEVEPARALDEDDLLGRVAAAGRDALLLVLDGVQDPHNLGACLRTADAVGATAVVGPRDRACGLTPVVRKVAAGAAETVPFVQVTNLARTLRQLQEQGVWIIGLAGEATQTLHAADLTGPLAVVMGAEGAGMRRLTREGCDFLVSLPMRGAVESLNVSVAAGVVLYEALRQREHAAVVAKNQ